MAKSPPVSSPVPKNFLSLSWEARTAIRERINANAIAAIVAAIPKEFLDLAAHEAVAECITEGPYAPGNHIRSEVQALIRGAVFDRAKALLVQHYAGDVEERAQAALKAALGKGS
jgi:hypothetical protein